MSPGTDELVLSRTSGVLRPDPRRVVARLFVPGHEHLVHGRSRATPVLERILAMDPALAAATLAYTMDRFATRYADLPGILAENFAAVGLDPPIGPPLAGRPDQASFDRRLFQSARHELGATAPTSRRRCS